MATGVIVGDLVGDAVARLSDVIIAVTKKTSKFKSNLIQIQETITSIKPIFNEIERLNKVLDRPQQETRLFIAQLKGAEDLVWECRLFEFNISENYKHACRLGELNASLLRFFQINAQFQQTRDVINDPLKEMSDIEFLVEIAAVGVQFSEVPLPGVPLPEGVVVGFDKVEGVVVGFDKVEDLKAMVLKDSAIDDCSVVVVSAAAGFGKTMLVQMLCRDLAIQGKFGNNIYFATVSNTPNIKVIIKNFCQMNPATLPDFTIDEDEIHRFAGYLGRNIPNLIVIIKSILQVYQATMHLDFTSDEDAIQQWGSFLDGNKSDILLVLDDVWSVSIVNDFKFKLPGYKILVTSRFNFTQFDTYELQPLNHQDAVTLFRHYAFSECGSERTDMPDDLVDKLVKSCKKHPLTLCILGSSLKGKRVEIWLSILKMLSVEQHSILDLTKDMLLCLARSLDVFEEESVIKQCYLDLGLFPEDQKIAATALMDMWVHLYKHDGEGIATLKNLSELSSLNLATVLPIRKDSHVIANYCEEKAVMQHDMMRALAIHLSSQEPVEQRKRLIINADGEDLPQWTEQLQQTLDARILSISTGELFASRWNDLQVPKVEVLVLNFMSRIYTLPQFMQKMERLNVLIITHYGFHFTKLQNFPAPQCLSSLTSIRLEHVSIPSISSSILELVNLRKLSLIMCEIGNSFDESTLEIPNKLHSLLEIDIESCEDLVTFPSRLCTLVNLQKLSITNCFELISLSEGFGQLTNLKVLKLTSCSKLAAFPESMRNLRTLSIIVRSYIR